MTNPRRAAAALLAGLAVATTLATQGCDAGPAAQAATAAHPDLTVAQARAVYQSYLTSSDTAAAQGDSAADLSVVADAALLVAHAQYALRAATGAPVKRYVYGTPTFYVPIVSGYPHWFVVEVPRRTLGSKPTSRVNTLMVFGESKPTDAWTLDGAAALLPGQTLPAIATDAKGYAISLSPNQQGLLLQPNVVGGTQAAVVDEGPEHPAANLVAPGSQTTDLYSQQAAIGSGTAKDLLYSWVLEGSPFPLFALRTTSGAALVIYGMYLNTELAYLNKGVGATAPLSVAANVRAVFTSPAEVASRAVYTTWTYEFAAIDPPANESNGKATVIAATSAITSAHAD